MNNIRKLEKSLPQWLLLLALLPTAARGGGEQPPPSPLPQGVVLERISCRANPSQSYALYLPSQYTPARRWPIVYAFDPGAQGSLPVKLLKEAAERYGYIVAGSNNSRNGPLAESKEAADAMWIDTHARLSVDDRRVYVAGFSGGARFATYLALWCGNCVAGVFAQGAGFPEGVPVPEKFAFNYFAAIGHLDFNFPEVAELSEQLDARGLPNRLRRFQGPHRWAPEEVWMEALEWMELLAMKDSHRPRDEAFIAAQLKRVTERAMGKEEAGDLYAAYYEYRKAAEDFQGLAETALLARKATALAESNVVREARERERTEMREQAARTERIFLYLEILEEESPEPAQLTSNLALLRRAIQDLRAEVEKAGGAGEALVARRTLGRILANAFESGEAKLRTGDSARAARYFDVAVEIAPNSPWPRFQLARAHAATGNNKQALADLREAIAKGFTSAALLRETGEFAPLQDDKEFQELLQGLAPSAPPP